MNASGCFSIPKQLSIVPAAHCQFELWLAWKQLGKDQPCIYLLAGPRSKIKEFLYVFTCSEVLIRTYLVLIKRNRSTWLAFFLGHSLFSRLCPMKLAPVFVFHVSGWYMATEKLFLQNVGGVFGHSFICKIINSERSEDSSHHPIYLWLGEHEGRADKNKLGQLLIQSIDNVKFLNETWGFSLYQISCPSFSTQDTTKSNPLKGSEGRLAPGAFEASFKGKYYSFFFLQSSFYDRKDAFHPNMIRRKEAVAKLHFCFLDQPFHVLLAPPRSILLCWHLLRTNSLLLPSITTAGTTVWVDVCLWLARLDNGLP